MATQDDVRRIALSLPGVEEKTFWGTPGFKVKDKGFLRVRTEAEGGLVVFVADLSEKEALLSSDPSVYFTTPHYDGHATVLVNVANASVGELEDLITESWRLKAPTKLLAAFDAEWSGGAGPT
ncbi:MAG TPA: MmcQ/YjbR family DNA-binding protein [Acidimicrobiales bacterium]|nr:MmcQ/YjbR family DNA-binding protein [Acidimicrobiales bacterium]